MNKFDVIIVGGGHNGLVCACYLAKAGHKVKVLERRHIVGGAAVTEEFHPGFRNSTASYTVSLLNPKIIEDLHLQKHGLRIILRPYANFLPLPDGQHLRTGSSLSETQKRFALHSKQDAAQLPAYYEMLEGVADIIRAALLETPPNSGGGIIDLVRSARMARRLTKLSELQRQNFLDLMTKSAGDILDAWFESDAIKALFGFDSIVGNFASPYTPGSGYVLLHHVIGEANGQRGQWGHVIGGMGGITQAILKEAQALGVQVQTNAPVTEITTSKSATTGVVLENGSQFEAKCVASNLHPVTLYNKLLNKAEIPASFRSRIRRYKSASGTLRINVALSELPKFLAAPDDNGKHLRSGIIIGPSLQYMEQAFFDAKQVGFAAHPVVEMLIPSTIDDTLAPAGAHVASLFCQHFNPELPPGEDWESYRDKAANLVFDTVNAHAPNFKASIVGALVLTPKDLEQRFGLINGDIFHGVLSLDQLYSARPLLGYGNYRGPLKGLYMCGSGTHPGGGVSGIPGHNAAWEIIKDLK